MGIQQFTALLQDQVYRTWVKKLDSTIATKTATQLRTSQLIAEKTRFYITESQLLNVLKTIAGEDFKIDKSELQLMLREIATGGVVNLTQQEAQLEKIPYGIDIKINGEAAIKFDSISYALISKRLQGVLEKNQEIQRAFKKAEEDFEKSELAALKSNPKYQAASTANKRKIENDIRSKAKERAELGYYFNKGHVISVATNLARQFQQQIKTANELAQKQKDLLVKILDEYIANLEKEDYSTANLPDAVYQQMWAGYEKDPEKYIVELQIRAKNLSSGSLSRSSFDELRSIISPNTLASDLGNIIKGNVFLENLANTAGSRSFVELQVQRLVDALTGKKSINNPTKVPATKIGERKVTVNKPKSNAGKIKSLKKLRNNIASIKPKSSLVKNISVDTANEAVSIVPKLQQLLDIKLVNVIKQNMGTGARRDILNLRSGRFAESVNVEQISESRQGMVTAFYNYMRNPYATFSQSGRQQYPRSRDPKVLISKSIRQIAQELAITRLRAQLI